MSMTTVLQSVTIILFSIATVINSYVVSPTSGTWADAKAYCADKGQLASIHTCADNDAAKAACFTTGAGCWIGLNQETTIPYQWDDGTGIDYGFINNDATMTVPGAGNPWAINQPSLSGWTGQCIYLWRRNSYGWDDTSCGTSGVYALCNGVETTNPTVDPTTAPLCPTTGPTTDPTTGPTTDPTTDDSKEETQIERDTNSQSFDDAATAIFELQSDENTINKNSNQLWIIVTIIIAFMVEHIALCWWFYSSKNTTLQMYNDHEDQPSSKSNIV